MPKISEKIAFRLPTGGYSPSSPPLALPLLTDYAFHSFEYGILPNNCVISLANSLTEKKAVKIMI